MTFPSHRKEDIEAKYYADGEDAFAMRRDLSHIAEQIEREKQEQRQKARSSTTKALPAPSNSGGST